eukprot:COSAG02_NODE_51796_length_312_cov_0.366197_1_plen_29_part_10
MAYLPSCALAAFLAPTLIANETSWIMLCC